MPDGRGVVLAFDHGLEHGPLAYKGTDLSPERIIRLAGEGGADAVLLHKGMVREKIPRDTALIIKLTGKSALSPVETQSVVSDVENAVALGADAVAATIYFCVENEPAMLAQFRRVWSAARAYGLPVIAFAYPRVPEKRRYEEKFVLPATRAAAELGADIVKTYYTGGGESWARVVGSAGAPVLAAGGKMKEREAEVLGMVREIMSAGGAGIAVGRNVWQRPDGAALLRKIVAIVHS